MTVFGMALHGVMPAIADPEMGLSLFFRANTGAVFTGIITADIFATIAATSNSLLVAMAQTMSRDLFGHGDDESRRGKELWPLTAALGAATMILSLNLHNTVVDLALSSVSLLEAGLAPVMLIRVLGWRRTDISLIVTVLVGSCTAILWRSFGLSGFMNEAAPGISSALLANFIFTRFSGGSEQV
jgi:Na+/proline symporter